MTAAVRLFVAAEGSMFLGSRRLIGQSVNGATHAWLGDRCLRTRPGERYFLRKQGGSVSRLCNPLLHEHAGTTVMVQCLDPKRDWSGAHDSRQAQQVASQPADG